MQQGRSIGSMYTTVSVLVLCLAVAEAGTAQELPLAEALTVKPVTQRISDQAIEADKRVFAHLRTT